MNDTEAIRIDKWLWAARFFKTRRLATEAVKLGHIRVNNSAAKPSRTVRSGDRLHIEKGRFEYHVEVLDVDDQRGPATRAQQLYRESADSIARRESVANAIRTERLSRPVIHGRPNKKERRQIIRFNRDQPE